MDSTIIGIVALVAPLIGVTLGWWLKDKGDQRREDRVDSRETQQLVKAALSGLLSLHNQVSLAIGGHLFRVGYPVQTQAKSDIRQFSQKALKKQLDKLTGPLDRSVEALAQIDPIAANNIRSLFSAYSWQLDTDFSSFVDDTDKFEVLERESVERLQVLLGLVIARAKTLARRIDIPQSDLQTVFDSHDKVIAEKRRELGVDSE